MIMKKILIIYNPYSGKGNNSKKIKKQLENIALDYGYKLKVVKTKMQNDATEIVEKLSHDQIVDENYQPFGDGHSANKIVEAIETAFPDSDFIVEGEIIATRNGEPLSFQHILRRVRRKYNIKETMENIPVELYLYDLLYYKEPLIDNPIKTRRETLESIVNTTDMIHLSKLVLCGPENIDDAKELFEESIKGGHEGIMIKNAYEPYIPGIRGKKMLKYKAEPENLDVVVVGGTKGIGKRGEFIGSYLIALQDEDENLKPIAQVGTGLSDEQLENLTEKMEEYKISQKGTKITVEPKIIFEVAYSEIVKSPEYEGGYSLRFPVVKRIREDKGLKDIDTIERLESLYKG